MPDPPRFSFAPSEDFLKDFAVCYVFLYGSSFFASMDNDAEISPTCRAEWSRRVITDLFAVCLCGKSDCPHQVDVDGLGLCFHPARKQIIAQTDAARAASWRTGNLKTPATSVA